MNIIEAVKSGKRFRPKDNNGEWYFVNRGDIKVQIAGLDAINVFLHTSLLSDDWEVEEEKVEITKSQAEDLFFLGRKTKPVQIGIPCPDGNLGCLAYHAKIKEVELEKKLKELGFDSEKDQE